MQLKIIEGLKRVHRTLSKTYFERKGLEPKTRIGNKELHNRGSQNTKRLSNHKSEANKKKLSNQKQTKEILLQLPKTRKIHQKLDNSCRKLRFWGAFDIISIDGYILHGF